MNKQKPSAIWGLNFLQDDKSKPDQITGTYDPEQEVWVMSGEVQSSLEVFSNRLLRDSLKQKISLSTPTYRYVQRTTWKTTKAGSTTDRVASDETTDRIPD